MVLCLNFDSNELASGSVDTTVKCGISAWVRRSRSAGTVAGSIWCGCGGYWGTGESSGWRVDDVWIKWRAEDMSREAVVFGFGWWEYSSLGPCTTDVHVCLHNPSLPHWSATMSTKYGCGAHHGILLSYPSEH
jgi:hypothetical protein